MIRGEIGLKKWLIAILFGTILTLGACGGGGNSDGDAKNNNANNGNGDTASAAEDVYQKSCMACHGGNLDDGSAPDLTAIGSKYSADEIEDIIENGIGGMPAQKQVSDDDRELLASWLADKK